MSQYKVISQRLGVHKEGDLVSKKDLGGANIQALLEGGHLAEIGSKSNKKLDTKDESL
jgi:hypothetical protein